MLIKMVTLMAGPLGVREAGKIYEVPDVEAGALIEGKYAVMAKVKGQVVAAPEPETAGLSVEGVEKASRGGGRRGRGPAAHAAGPGDAGSPLQGASQKPARGVAPEISEEPAAPEAPADSEEGSA